MSAALTVVDKDKDHDKPEKFNLVPYAPRFNADHAQSALRALHDGITLREHCRTMQKADPDYPSPSTIYAWASSNAGGFYEQYAIARRAQAHHWAEDIIQIAEDGTNDWMERRRANGELAKSVDSECVQRSKLRVDTRRWLLSKLHPDIYADRVQHQQLGANGQPVDPPSAVNPIDLSAALKGWKPKE
jgi:hypothetical protein